MQANEKNGANRRQGEKAKIALKMTVGKSDISYTGYKPPDFKFKLVIWKKYNRQLQHNYCASNIFKFVFIFI